MSKNNLRRNEARQRAHLLTDLRYDVELDLTGAGETFPSRTRISFACAEPGAGTFVDLYARSVESIRLNGVQVDRTAFSGDRVALENLRERNELEVVANCVYQHTGVGLHRFTDPVDQRVYLHTQFEPFDAHRMFACFDQPDLKGRFALSVEAPEDWLVVANREPVERPAEGQAGRWRFAETLLMSSYLIALVAGPYHHVHRRHREIDLGVYCRHSLAEHLDADEIFEITAQGFDYFTDRFDYPYPFGKYDQLLVPEFNWGAMENPGCVTFSEGYIFRSKVTEAARQQRAGTILHEMAHMWFGDLVTMRWWDDLWLNESFATYMGHRAVAEATRFERVWADFHAAEKAWALVQDQLPSTHPIVADIPDTDAVATNFDGITYAKGAAVLRQLVAWVGDDAFFSGLRDYFRRHEFANAELSDFLAALEKGSSRELDAWSAEWLQTAGVATLCAEFELDDEDRYRSFAVVQEADESYPTLRAHRVALGCYEDGPDGLVRTKRFELDVVGARTDVPQLAGRAQPDLLLINDDDLTFAKIRLDERSLYTVERAFTRLDDPLARTLCWGATWDMTRDAQMPARRFVRLVADHAAAEHEVAVLQTLLHRATAAIDRYGDPANRQQVRALLGERARQALDASEPGSDLQLIWARCAITHAQTDADIAWGRALLDGDASVDGLAVDTDLRWHIVGALASKGHAGEALIQAEHDRDATDIGARRAAAARASQPLAEAKEQAWTGVLDSSHTTLAMQRAMCSGFSHFGQEDLLARYVERYVDALPAMWTDRDMEESLLLTQALYPSVIITQDTVEAADRALADERLPAPARRLVLEGRDNTLRALRAREVDRD